MTRSKRTPVEALVDHLEEFGQDLPWTDLSRKYNPGGKITWARAIAESKGWDFNHNTFTVAKKVEETKHIKTLRKHKNESSMLTERIIELEHELELLKNVKEYNPRRFDIPAPTSLSRREATAIVQWSDWHVDERVDSRTVNGMNEFNKEIARRRAFKLFENTVKLTESQRSAVAIRRLVIHAGGDSIGGHIHPELVQTNTMSPLEGIFYAKELHIAGIDYQLKYGRFDEITLVCSRGNHSRLTPKMQHANDYNMNLETFLFYSLMDHYRNNPKVAFRIDQSELSYLTIYDKVLRFFHGWQVKSQGGIGGIGIPLYKKIHRWNNNKPAYYNFMCDKHTYSNPTPDCQLNGSLKGFDTYAESNGFPYQPPIQSFTLLDSKRGITVKAPIYCD
jgi:hypothetical protein